MIYVDCTLLALVPFQLIYFIVSCVRVDGGDAWGRGHLEKKSENTFLSSRQKLGVPLTPKKIVFAFLHHSEGILNKS